MEFTTDEANTALRNALNSVGKNSRSILNGSSEEKDFLLEQIQFSDTSVAQIIATSQALNAREWFSNRKKQLIAELSDYGYDEADLLGVWSGQLANHQTSMHLDITSGKPYEQVLSTRVTVGAPWEIPAHFKFGGWNDCPPPEIHCAVWKYWHSKYGAEIVSVSHDVIEAWVVNPPSSKEEAMTLAWEQFLYCEDIVSQGVGTLAGLGGSLFHSNSWYFWWD